MTTVIESLDVEHVESLIQSRLCTSVLRLQLDSKLQEQCFKKRYVSIQTMYTIRNAACPDSNIITPRHHPTSLL